MLFLSSHPRAHVATLLIQSYLTDVCLCWWFHFVCPSSQGRSGVSDFVSGVSILFCDIKGFTTISSTIPPKTVVDMLHTLFTGFDRLTDKYQVLV
jgi:class 3 adenylate cyclase